YESANRTFPPGINYPGAATPGAAPTAGTTDPYFNHNAAPPAPDMSRNYCWFVALLPYVEQDAIYNQWDFSDSRASRNTNNGQYGPNAVVARYFKTMLCPSDRGLGNPPVDNTQSPPEVWALISYKGCAGGLSFPNVKQTRDGIFYVNHRGHSIKDIK